jgi:hypothetical protein
MMRRIHGMVLMLSTAGLWACSEDVDSDDVRTSGVYAEMEVVAEGDGSSTVTVDLTVGGSNSNTHLEMAGEDELTATVGDETQTLRQRGNVYETTFGVDAEDTEFTVAFLRGAEDEGAPDSHVTLPAPFEITAPESGAAVSRAEGVVVTWEPSGADDSMAYRLNGDCIFLESGDVADSGSLDLGPSDFDPHSGDEETTCSAELCIDRTRRGSLDPAYGEGGRIEAVQRRCVTFSSTP